MYYQNYEDYIRSILGYPTQMQNNNYCNYSNYNYTDSATNINANELYNLYPEIYRIINPMVCKICEANTKPVTRELVDKMTDEIYLNLESDSDGSEVVNVRVNLPPKETNRIENNNKSGTVNKTAANKTNNESLSGRTSRVITNTNSSSIEKNKDKIDDKNTMKENIKEKTENRNIERKQNRTLRDLIKILILNRLLGEDKPSRPPQRPPLQPPQNPRPNYPNFPNQPSNPNIPRPPFPGGPRPPIEPRIF